MLRQSTSAYLQKQNIDTKAIAQEYNSACHAKVTFLSDELQTRECCKADNMARIASCAKYQFIDIKLKNQRGVGQENDGIFYGQTGEREIFHSKSLWATDVLLCRYFHSRQHTKIYHG